MARQGLFFIPLVWVLNAWLGFTGIQLTQPAADVITFLCAVPIQLHVLRSMPADR